MKRSAGVTLVLLTTSTLLATHSPRTEPGCPQAQAPVADRVTAVFNSHQFVFIGSTHGGIKRHEFLLCLLSRPAFQATVTDIVVEFVSGAHQGLLDRYLLHLEGLPADAPRPLSFDTDYPQLLATIPQVPEFLQAVRKVNEGLDPSRLFVIGTIASLRDGERQLLSRFGDPERPFFLAAKDFPEFDRLPDDLTPSLGNSSEPPSRVLARKIDALVYLGPSPDRDLKGTIPFSAEEQRELRRRDAFPGREAMMLRLKARDRWFQGHPGEIPPDPRRGP